MSEEIKRKSNVEMEHLKISNIKPYVKNWFLMGRVKKLSDIKCFETKKGEEGKFFDFELIDQSGAIRISSFDKDIQFYDILKENKVIRLSDCDIKSCNRKYASNNHEYEMRLHSKSVLVVLVDDSNIPQTFLDLKSLKTISVLPEDLFIDTIGIIVNVMPNKEQDIRKEIEIVDESNSSITCFLWKEKGEQINEQCVNKVILIQNGRISKYNGKSINAAKNSTVTIDPTCVDTTGIMLLLKWFNTENMNELVKLSTLKYHHCALKDQKLSSIRELNDNAIPNQDELKFYTTRAKIVDHYSDYFYCCKNKTCSNKKISFDSKGMPHCQTCGYLVEAKKVVKLRFKITDVGENTNGQHVLWATCFGEIAQKLEMCIEKENFLLLFKLKASLNTYNGCRTVKYVAIDCDLGDEFLSDGLKHSLSLNTIECISNDKKKEKPQDSETTLLNKNDEQE